MRTAVAGDGCKTVSLIDDCSQLRNHTNTAADPETSGGNSVDCWRISDNRVLRLGKSGQHRPIGRSFLISGEDIELLREVLQDLWKVNVCEFMPEGGGHGAVFSPVVGLAALRAN